jgi:hypothetical protein
MIAMSPTRGKDGIFRKFSPHFPDWWPPVWNSADAPFDGAQLELAGRMDRSITRNVVPAVLIAFATAAMAIPSNAMQRDGRAQPLIVAVAESPPFAIQNADGVWSGLSVDLWREIADQLQLRYDLREVDLARIADLLRDRTVDAGLGAIAVSAEGEAMRDFS